jgi:hypothetical protein
LTKATHPSNKFPKRNAESNDNAIPAINIRPEDLIGGSAPAVAIVTTAEAPLPTVTTTWLSETVVVIIVGALGAFPVTVASEGSVCPGVITAMISGTPLTMIEFRAALYVVPDTTMAGPLGAKVDPAMMIGPPLLYL